MNDREGYRWRKSAWPSPAQRRVLDALTEGGTNAQIARRLGISFETVKWHISQLLGQTSFEGRITLARWWQRTQRKGPTMTSTATENETPALTAAVPVLMTGDLPATVAFFEQLEFKARYNDGSYAILGRDAVELHFGLQEGLDPKENMHECRVNVRNIEGLFAGFPPSAIHPNGALSVKPYGMKEFAILDPGGICVIFGERV